MCSEYLSPLPVIKVYGGHFASDESPVAEFDWPTNEDDEEFQKQLGRYRTDDAATAHRLLCPCGHKIYVRKRKLQDGVWDLWSEPGVRHGNEKCPKSEDYRPPRRRLTREQIARHEGTVTRRVRLDLQDYARSIRSEFQGDPGTPWTGEEAEVSRKRLGGLLSYMNDMSELSEWWPDRSYAKDLAQIEHHLSEAARRIAVLNEFSPKLVFPIKYQSNSEIGEAIRSACCNNKGAPSGLHGSALVVNIQPWFSIDPMFELKFPGHPMFYSLAAARQVVEAFKRDLAGKDKITSARQGMLKLVGKRGSEAYLHVIALVEPVEEKGILPFLRATKFAWRLIDQRGLMYESAYEFEAGTQLATAGIRHKKPAAMRYKFGENWRKPDFFVSDRTGRYYVLEVDVGDSGKRSKLGRDGELDRAGIEKIIWDPHKKPDLLDAMREQGFEW